MMNMSATSVKQSIDFAGAELRAYSTHTLDELKHSQLMDRVDTKYLFPIMQLPQLLAAMRGHYSALEIDGIRRFSYHNVYFDTPEYAFYQMHHRGKLNRYKVRQRNYLDTHTRYLEVKFKNNKGRTIKSRINLDKQGEPARVDFLNQQIGHWHSQIKPVQEGAYCRIALANEPSAERITLDTQLTFGAFAQEKSVSLAGWGIAELKQSKHRAGSPFARLMAQLGIRPTTFSKYCMGCALVFPALKTNRFKPQLNAIGMA